MLLKNTKLNMMHNRKRDEVYTPDYAIDILLPFIPEGKVIYECAVGTGQIKKYFVNKGYEIVTSDDFLNDERDKFDIIVTNPPYSIKDKFITKCFELQKPFALLLPITALEGQLRQQLYKQNDIQILFPKKRIDFNGKGACWFYTAWFTYGLNLPKQLNFI